MNKQSFYFSHDYNARADIKIKKVIINHGYEGYGIYWALIEDLYQNANPMPLDYDSISYDLRTSSDIIKSIINDFDLFVVEEDVFGSLSVQRRIDHRNEKSRKARQSAMKRWHDDADALRDDPDRNPKKERKGKERKRKETYTKSEFDFKKSLIAYGFEKELVDEWMAIRNKRNAVNSEFAYNCFIAQIERAGGEKNELMRIIAEKQWAGFNHAWMKTLNNNLKNIENETDRRVNESLKRKQELYEYARSVGMAGGEEK